MAVGLAARGAAASDPNFTTRVTEAIAEAAVAIYNEGPSATGHVARALYAVAVLANPLAYTNRFAQAAVTQGVDNTSTDAQIAAAIASVWNALAGA